MVTIETPTTVIKNNQSKVKRNRDEWHDFVLPPELETRQDQEAEQPHIGPEQEEPGTAVPVADPDISDSGVAAQMQKQSLACGICGRGDTTYHTCRACGVRTCESIRSFIREFRLCIFCATRQRSDHSDADYTENDIVEHSFLLRRPIASSLASCQCQKRCISNRYRL